MVLAAADSQTHDIYEWNGCGRRKKSASESKSLLFQRWAVKSWRMLLLWLWLLLLFMFVSLFQNKLRLLSQFTSTIIRIVFDSSTSLLDSSTILWEQTRTAYHVHLSISWYLCKLQWHSAACTVHTWHHMLHTVQCSVFAEQSFCLPQRPKLTYLVARCVAHSLHVEL